MDSRVLIIEDDRRIRDMLQRSFAADGYQVTAADSAEAGLAAIRSSPPHVVVLDIGLPGMDGIEACRRIRREGHDAAILLLTARGDLEDRVAGLDAGADDYLAKPFEYAELAARVRALVRRSFSEASNALCFGDLVVDVDAHSARRGERIIDLSPREFALLELLVRNPRITISRGRIIEDVWDDAIDIESNAPEVYVGYLRKKLEAGGEARVIHTIRGIGYSLRGADV